MSTEPATPPAAPAAPASRAPQNPLQAAQQSAQQTHPANKGPKALTTPIGDLVKKAFDKKPEQPAQEQKPAEAAKQTEQPKTEAKTETTEKKTKSSLFDRKEKTEAKTETKTEDLSGPEDAFELPATADETKRSQFSELKTITKQLRRELQNAQTQIEASKKAAPAATEEVTTLKQQYQQALDRLAILDLQSHPDFAKQYVEPKNKAIAEAKMLLTDNGNTEVDAASLLSLPRPEFAKKVSELASKMQDFDKASFTNAMREAYRLHGDSSQALTKASELAQQLQQKTALKQKQAFEEVWGKLGEAGEFLITLEAPEGATAQERQEIAAYNQSVADVRKTAESYAFGQTDERQVASMSAKAATLDFLVKHGIPRMEKEYTALRTLNEQLLNELRSLKGAKETGTPSGDSKPDGAPKKASVQDLVAQAFGKR